MSNESENRIDLTQFEGMTKGPWEFPPLSGLMLVTAYPHPLIVKQENGEGNCRLQLGKINSNYDGAAIAKLPDLIAELKRCYDLIDKMQYSIVKNRGDCWDCDMPIDSCDARTCERQMLEDIELGTASE
jgi:hypothetical protein